MQNTQANAKPFLKWAGGKTQLIEQIVPYLPPALRAGKINHYYEPFLGGGALFFHLIQKYSVSKASLSDINRELILTYQVIQQGVEALSELLYQHSKQYLKLTEVQRESYYYNVREEFNAQRDSIDYHLYSEAWIHRAAQILFLNKTCYNGLFRLNKKGCFNVPFGRYKKPAILHEENLWNVARLLQNVEIINADFSYLLKEQADSADSSFIYFDPPYRPVSKTACFTAYSTSRFDDQEQIRLASTFSTLAAKGFYLMLSNSAAGNELTKGLFFDQLYQNFHIHRVKAKRMINSKAERRAQVQEILVTNY